MRLYISRPVRGLVISPKNNYYTFRTAEPLLTSQFKFNNFSPSIYFLSASLRLYLPSWIPFHPKSSVLQRPKMITMSKSMLGVRAVRSFSSSSGRLGQVAPGEVISQLRIYGSHPPPPKKKKKKITTYIQRSFVQSQIVM